VDSTYRLVVFFPASCHTFVMVEQADNAATGVHEGRISHRRRSFNVAAVRARTAGVLTALVRWVGTLAAALLVLHVVFTLGGANPDNGITRFVTNWARPLALGFENLFTPADPRLAVLVNYGIAALFWLIITSVAVRILRAIGGDSRQ
jgi:hypothetical protein